MSLSSEPVLSSARDGYSWYEYLRYERNHTPSPNYYDKWKENIKKL